MPFFRFQYIFVFTLPSSRLFALVFPPSCGHTKGDSTLTLLIVESVLLILEHDKCLHQLCRLVDCNIPEVRLKLTNMDWFLLQDSPSVNMQQQIPSYMASLDQFVPREWSRCVPILAADISLVGLTRHASSTSPSSKRLQG